MNDKKRYELYQTTPSVGGEGMFYFTECGNMMYHIGHDPLVYHKKLCPRCMLEKNCDTVLLLAGTPEAKKHRKEWRSNV